MSDRYPGSIEIGGRIPKRLIKRLAATIEMDGGMLGQDWDGTRDFDAAKELQRAADEKTTFAMCDDEANGGQFSDLEEFLATNKIAFRRQSSGKYEDLPEVRIFLPETMAQPMTTIATDEGEPIIALSTLKKNQHRPLGEIIKDYEEVFEATVPALEIA